MHHFDPQELKSMYLDKGMSAYEIGKTFGVPHSTIIRHLRKAGVQTRSVMESGSTDRKRELLFRAKFKGGTKVKGGYHQTCSNTRTKGKTVRFHRLVAAQALGRELTLPEVVHHCDEDKLNNRPDNLWVFPSRSDHSRYHQTGTIHPDTLKLSEFVMCGDNHGTR